MRIRGSSRGVAALALAGSLALAACGGESAAKETGPATVTVGPEAVAVVRTEELRAGPGISGTLTAERAATVRAEIPGSVLQTLVDRGQRVAAGAPLARLDDAALREGLVSAQTAVRSAEIAVADARRDLERSERLSAAGAVADREVETARSRLAGAQAQLSGARAQQAQAREQLRKTSVRSPIAGVVSERPVNAGDVVQPGTALFTVVDPGSMRLEASVAAAQLGQVRVGVPVRFTVSGYPGRTFTGTVQRINPAADPATRQVPIVIAIPNAEGALVSGLFAEGRVESEARQGIAVPANAVDERGVQPAVLRLRGGKAERVPVQLGARDTQTDRVEVLSGLQPGDTLLVGGALGTTPGTPVRVRQGAAAPVSKP